MRPLDSPRAEGREGMHRHQYADALTFDTIDRPAVPCVWEPEIIAAEQTTWRETMMILQPETSGYPRVSAA